MKTTPLDLEKIEKYRKDCLSGTLAKETNVVGLGVSKKGGMPHVDEDFQWPHFKNRALSFISQIACTDCYGLPEQEGCLLFFWDERHWGYEKGDFGAFRVIHIKKPTKIFSVLPMRKKKILGLFPMMEKPHVWIEKKIEFTPGKSYPGLERDLIDFGQDETIEEKYCDFQANFIQDFQSGGYPDPIQGDWMEDDCIKYLRKGSRESWKLLLQIQSSDDMMWGDAGCLYWFIEESDLQKMNFDSVWFSLQCG